MQAVKKEEEMKQQQKMKTMTNMIRKIKAKGRVDANRSWWVSELLAADCKKAWLHPKWMETMQRWYNLQHEMKKKDMVKRKEEHQKLVSRMIASADETNGLERRSASFGRGGEECQELEQM